MMMMMFTSQRSTVSALVHSNLQSVRGVQRVNGARSHLGDRGAGESHEQQRARPAQLPALPWLGPHRRNVVRWLFRSIGTAQFSRPLLSTVFQN